MRPLFFQPLAHQARQRLPRQVADSLARIFPTDHKEAHMGIRQQVANQVLDAQVLGMQAADDGQAGRAHGGKPRHQVVGVESAHRHWRPEAQYPVVPG